MNKSIAKPGIFLLLILLITGVHADEKPYFGVGYSGFTLDVEVPAGDTIDFDMNSFRLTMGSHLTNNFGLETRLVLKGSGDSNSGVSLDPEYIISFLANFNFPAGPITLFANAGYSFTQFRIDLIEDLTFDEEGASIGAGVNFDISNNLSIYADATSYLISHDDFDVNSVSAGVRFQIQ